MSAVRRLLNLIVKEFAMILRDPKSRAVVIVPPILQFFVFGYAATFDLTDVRFAVLDRSHSAESRALIAAFDGSPHFERTRDLGSVQEIREVVDRREVRLVLHVPPDFARDLHTGTPASVQVVLDGRNSNVASVALGYVREIVDRFGASLARPDGSRPPPAAPVLVERAWFNENLESRPYIVSALGGVISMVVVMLLSSMSVARERESGTFDQLLVAPFRPWEILVGKAVPGIAFGLANGLLLSIAAILWFGIPFRGSWAALVVALLTFMIAVVGVGLFVSSLSTTLQQGMLGSFVYIMPSVILGGFTTPIENMPDWLRPATAINPLRHVVAALREVFLVGADTAAIVPHLGPLLAIAAVTLPAAAWMFRRRTT